MTADPLLDEVYREVILDHYRNPRHPLPLPRATWSGEGSNPLCGDEIRVECEVSDGTLVDIATGGSGCSISQASASMMADALRGKRLDDAAGIAAGVKAMLLGGALPEDVDIGDLGALSGVARLPVRVKCAVLAWKVIDELLASPPTTRQAR